MSTIAPIPTGVELRTLSRTLVLTYESEGPYELTHEFLRVYTPSAEARGHGPGQEILQAGKQDVSVVRIEPIGNYALKFVFSDGHDTGIYSWDLLHEFCQHRDALWENYLLALEAQGLSRDPQSNSIS